jgi:hypothetical protein
MAPRRGGSSSSSSSGYGSSNQCTENGAFSERNSIASISIGAIALFSLLLVLDLWMRARKKNPVVKEVLTVWGFGLALVMLTM